MKMRFTLVNVSGADLFRRFAAAINEEGVGYDADVISAASLSEDGGTWKTAWSGFTYSIVNPTSDEPARVMYEGGFRGFLAQQLLPCELFGDTTQARVYDGSVVDKHPAPYHEDAKMLAKAYGILQHVASRAEGGGEDPLAATIAAIEAVEEISRYMKEMRLDNANYATAGNGSSFPGDLRQDKDPSVLVTCCPGGRQVTSEFPIDVRPGYIEESAKQAVEQAKAWLDCLKPTLHLELEVA